MEIHGQQLEDEAKDTKYRHRWDKPMTMTQCTVPRTVPC
jgi:hypothetical protein